MTTLNSLICEKCGLHIGYVIYERWIDFDLILCKDCAEKEFKNMLLRERIK